MKVTIIHPERRTLQSIALDGHGMPKKLPPTHRCEIELQAGGSVEFVAGTAGNKKFGQVPLLIEVTGSADDHEFATLAFGTVPPNGKLEQAEAQFIRPPGVQRDAPSWSRQFGFVLKPGAELGFVLSNPAIEPA